MKQDVVRSDLLEVTDARTNLQLACHAGGADEWFTGGRKLTDQGVISKVG